jgi:hypothetical protein
MAYTMQDFRRDFVKEHLKDLTLEERLRGLTFQELLHGLTFQERLRGLSLEERLRDVPTKEIEKYLQRLKKPASPKRKNQKK